MTRSLGGSVFLVALAWLAGCAAPASGAQQQDSPSTLRVLFIGNSLTATNDLPGMVEALIDSAAAGAVSVTTVAYPNFGLEDHWQRGQAREAIREGAWDFVVLQQGPSATEGRPSLLEYSGRFAADIRAHGAEPALYMVWPAKARSFDFDGVSESYRMAAARVGGLLLPVGDAWRIAWAADSTLPLYGPDGFHPSPMGSYLGALVMFGQFTGRSPVGLPNTLSTRLGTVTIDSVVGALLQQAAEEVGERR
jgi:hypothetical protein